jgi:nitric oxide reductase NorD protein
MTSSPCAPSSGGREDVRLTRLKEFSEAFGHAALGRLAALRPAPSTRLGTALRHAQAEFGAVRTWRRLVLVLTDGEPSDHDAGPDDLVADARRAVLGLRSAGMEVFGVVLDPGGVGSATAIFGRANTVSIQDLADLPARLAGLYLRLARR